jgi:hypothetical protein
LSGNQRPAVPALLVVGRDDDRRRSDRVKTIGDLFDGHGVPVCGAVTFPPAASVEAILNPPAIEGLALGMVRLGSAAGTVTVAFYVFGRQPGTTWNSSI